jgi:hypothetical protein
MVDQIPTYKNVIFVGEYFTLMSTVELLEEARQEGETDDELAIRSASAWLNHHYGWDMEEHAREAGVIDD